MRKRKLSRFAPFTQHEVLKRWARMKGLHLGRRHGQGHALFIEGVVKGPSPCVTVETRAVPGWPFSSTSRYHFPAHELHVGAFRKGRARALRLALRDYQERQACNGEGG